MKKEIFEKIILAGIQAPSGDNMQPWKLKIGKNYNSFILKAKPEKNDFFDVENTATFISCGTFIENIVISARNFGYSTKIDYIDNDINSNEIAEISFKKISTNENYLYEEIFLRNTLRGPYKKKDLNPNFYSEVGRELLENKELNFKFFEISKNLVDILYRADLIRLFTKGAHETLYNNIRWSEEEVNKTKDGLDYRTLGIPLFAKQTLKVLSSWTLEEFLNSTHLNSLVGLGTTKEPLNSAKGICVLSIKNYSKINFIEGGRSFQKLWLILTKYGAYLQPFASITFFLRRLEKLKGEGFSQEQIEKLKNLKKEFLLETKISKKDELLIIFRYGLGDSPKIKSLRKDLKNFFE